MRRGVPLPRPFRFFCACIILSDRSESPYYRWVVLAVSIDHREVDRGASGILCLRRSYKMQAALSRAPKALSSPHLPRPDHIVLRSRLRRRRSSLNKLRVVSADILPFFVRRKRIRHRRLLRIGRTAGNRTRNDDQDSAEKYLILVSLHR